MSNFDPENNKWRTLDRDLGRLGTLEQAVAIVSKQSTGLLIACLFLGLVGVIAALALGFGPSTYIIVAAAVFGGYMAINIGANDVANAVGPLAAIVHAVQEGGFAGKVAIPLWVMVIGAFGISFGLVLFGPKLIRMVGTQITKLNPMRAYCVALSAAITVIVASWLGLPVSSTHIAVGAVFGVGFYREWYTERRRGGSRPTPALGKAERRHRKLVRRSHFMTIVAAWVITVPAAAFMSGVIFLILSGVFV